MASKTRKASSDRKSSARRIAGFSSGNVIEKKIRVGLAPSTRAAFTTSAGIATSPASRTSATNGVVFHTSTRMAAWSAGVRLPPAGGGGGGGGGRGRPEPVDAGQQPVEQPVVRVEEPGPHP